MAEKFSLVISPGCPYCEEAIRVLVENKKQCEIFVYDYDSPELEKINKEKAWKTVPMVTLLTDDERGTGQVFVGGCDDLKRYLNEDTTEDESEQEDQTT